MKTEKIINLTLILLMTAFYGINAYADNETTKDIPTYSFHIINDTSDLSLNYQFDDHHEIYLVGWLDPYGDLTIGKDIISHSHRTLNETVPVHFPITYSIKGAPLSEPRRGGQYFIKDAKIEDSTATENQKFLPNSLSKDYKVEGKIHYDPVTKKGNYTFIISNK